MEKYSLIEAIGLAEFYIECDIPFAFEGIHGIGKSQSLQKLASDSVMGFVDLRLTLLEETDLIGMPYFENEVTKYAKPIWLRMIEETGCQKGLISLEEINRADRLVRQPALQLLWDRRCLHWRLPDGWLPISTWNPSGESYETVELDPALLSRLVVLPIRVDAESWISWASQSDIHPDIISYISEYPLALDTHELSPRHWEMVSKVYSKHPSKLDLLKPILKEGHLHFQQFILTKNALPKAEEMFSDWDGVSSKIKGLVSNPGYLNYLNDVVVTHLLKLKKFDEATLSVFQNYLEMVNPDAALGALELLKKKDTEIATQILLAFKGNKKIRTKTISLMKHLFGDADV